MLAHIHPLFAWFTCPFVPPPSTPSSQLKVRVTCWLTKPPSAQSPFACAECYSPQDDLKNRLRGSYPSFIAPTSSCAKPNPSHRLHFPPPIGLCRLLPVPAGRWPFPTLSLRVFPWMLGPVPRRLEEVLLPVSSLHDIGLPPLGPGSAPKDSAQRLPSGPVLRGGSHSLMFRPPSLLATQVAPTAVAQGHTGQPWRLRPSGTRVVTFPRIGYASRPNRAIDDRGLSPH